MSKIWILIACLNGLCFPGNREFDTAESCQLVLEDMLVKLPEQRGIPQEAIAGKCVEKEKQGG